MFYYNSIANSLRIENVVEYPWWITHGKFLNYISKTILYVCIFLNNIFSSIIM